jgi:hypothetical protein
MSHGYLSRSEVARLPVYVQEELYRLNMRLEEAAKVVKVLRGTAPDDDAIATVSIDLNDRQALPLDGIVRWQFGRRWDRSIDVRRGLVDRNTIRLTSAGGTLAICPDAGNAVTIRMEVR